MRAVFSRRQTCQRNTTRGVAALEKNKRSAIYSQTEIVKRVSPTRTVGDKIFQPDLECLAHEGVVQIIIAL